MRSLCVRIILLIAVLVGFFIPANGAMASFYSSSLAANATGGGQKLLRYTGKLADHNVMQLPENLAKLAGKGIMSPWSDAVQALGGYDAYTGDEASRTEGAAMLVLGITTGALGEVAQGGKAMRYLDDVGELGAMGVAKTAGFANEAKLLGHFEKHGSEFAASSADDYLQIGRDIMSQGSKVEYLYKGESRTGFAQFMGNTSSGNAKFGFVGINVDGAITTIHTQSGNSFWKMLNGNATDKTIWPIR